MKAGLQAGMQTFAVLLTPDVMKEADGLAKRILAGDSAPERFASAVSAAITGAPVDGLKTVDAVKQAVRFLLVLADCPRNIARTVSERNRWDYYYRTAVQLTAEKLGVATAEKSVFDLRDYLNRVIKTLEKHNVPDAVLADVRDALKAAADVPAEIEAETANVPDNAG